jgi:hypothetical protein
MPADSAALGPIVSQAAADIGRVPAAISVP